MNDELAVFYENQEIRDILNDLRELLSQNRIAFLLGAGCSIKAGLPLMLDLTKDVLDNGANSSETKKLLKIICDSFTGSCTATIEDYMSEIVDHLAIAERRKQRGAAQAKILIGDQEYESSNLEKALDEIKKSIVSCINKNKVDISNHQRFVRAIHTILEAGKSTRTINYFVLNYDTLIEDALGLEKVTFIDGFTGGSTGWWDSKLFQNNNVAARVFKLHGSIDWCLLDGDSLPRRIRSNIITESEPKHVLIYPSATKYQETQRDPFAQIMKIMRDCLSPVGDEDLVLVICGYNFGDAHINLEIENALYQSRDYLQIAAFISQDEPHGKLKDWLDDPIISKQIITYSNKSYFHENKITSKKELPWWKFEILAKILGSEL